MERNILENSDDVFDGLVFENPNPLISFLAGRMFRKVHFDNESLQTMKDYSDKNIVFASFHTSNVALLILYFLLKRKGFKTPAYALEYNPFFLQPLRYIFRRISKYFNSALSGGKGKDIFICRIY
jgi:hypothetical protein